MTPKLKKKTSRRPTPRWDIFVSHASEDKEDFVQPLAAALAEFDLKVWYDRFTLSLGDSLSGSIDEGLASSRFGLVVLSPSFLSKRWPEYELRGLIAREIAGQKVILPIWHNISREDLLRFSPPLADKLAVDSKGLAPLQVALQIIRRIRPGIFQRIARRRAHIEMSQNAKTVFIDPKKIRSVPVQHPILPADLVGRIRLIRATFLEVYPHSLGFWIEGFKRDSHPTREVAIWEHWATVYQECCALHHELTSEQRKLLFTFIAALGMGQGVKAVDGLPLSILQDVSRAYAGEAPLHDFADDWRDRSVGEHAEHKDRYSGDTEHFPNDLPDYLIQQLIAMDKLDKQTK